MSAASLVLVSTPLLVVATMVERLNLTSVCAQVTGVSGYLGAHIVHELLEKGYRVRG